MPGQRIGSLIAAVFGLSYVLANAGALPAAWAMTLRGLAVVAFAAVLVAIGRVPGSGGERTGRPFARSYWAVVAAEVIALFAGVRVLDGPLDAPEAGVAWVSLVVGLHFFALAVVFGERFFHGLGAAITACGVAGLALAAAGTGEASIAAVGGVLPGALLLAFGWWGAHRTDPAAQPPASVNA